MTTPASYINRDPFQGFDISVKVTPMPGAGGGGGLEGSFTGFMCRIVNQTEAYLPLNQRIPRMLDGEIIVAWSLEQGMVNDQWVAATYGTNFAQAIKSGRTNGNVIPRQVRFLIEMKTEVGHIKDLGEASFNSGDGSDAALDWLTIKLHYCRVDTGSFGVVAGRRVAASSWQGTAQSLEATPDTKKPPATR